MIVICKYCGREYADDAEDDGKALIECLGCAAPLPVLDEPDEPDEPEVIYRDRHIINPGTFGGWMITTDSTSAPLPYHHLDYLDKGGF